MFPAPVSLLYHNMCVASCSYFFSLMKAIVWGRRILHFLLGAARQVRRTVMQSQSYYAQTIKTIAVNFCNVYETHIMVYLIFIVIWKCSTNAKPLIKPLILGLWSRLNSKLITLKKNLISTFCRIFLLDVFELFQSEFVVYFRQYR